MSTISQRFSIRQRLMLAFSILIATLLAASAFAAWRVHQINQDLQAMVNEDVLALDLSRTWAGLSEGNIQRRVVSMAVENPEFIAQFTKQSNEISKRVDEVQKQLAALPKPPEAEAILERVDVARSRYQKLRDALNLEKKSGQDTLPRITQELLPLVDAYLQALHDFSDFYRERLNQAEASAMAYAQNTTRLILVMMTAASLLALGMAVQLTRTISGPLNVACEAAESIAKGQLTHTLRAQGRGELVHLVQRLDAMQQQLVQSISGVRDVAEHVRLASGEIAMGSMDLSNRTEQAASSLEQTGAAMQQLREGVNTNAQAAHEADRLAQDTARIADQGGTMVQQVVTTMRDIQQASHRIADIIGVIDGIAFQTNILALNAAVEAARAGEQGRGFAVVASEVRSLAQRSAQAAREIKGLIGASAEQVENGNRLVADTGSTIAEVVTRVQRVSRVVADISQATSAQALTLGEIGQAVQNLDQMTQQNAALVEESAAAAEGLRQRACDLHAAVAVFQLPQAA